MTDNGAYDSNTWRPEPGANTGDARENDPASPGFTDDSDRVFRSQFQHANRGTKHSDQDVEKVETDVENGWLNVRVGSGEWVSTPDVPHEPIDPAHQGRVEGLPPAGTTPTHDRASYTDPLPGNADPTDPGRPEKEA